MEGEPVLEFFDIIEATLACIVGCVQGDAHVEAYDDEVEVVAQACACAEGDAAERFGREAAAGTVGIVAQQPHVAGIEEDGTVEVAEEACSEFGIGLELHVARLVHVGITRVGGTEGAGAE